MIEQPEQEREEMRKRREFLNEQRELALEEHERIFSTTFQKEKSDEMAST